MTLTWRDKDKELSSSPGCILSLGVQASLRSSWLPHHQWKLGLHHLPLEVLTSACFYLSLKIILQVCVKSRKQTVLKLPWECFTYVPQRRPDRLGESQGLYRQQNGEEGWISGCEQELGPHLFPFPAPDWHLTQLYCVTHRITGLPDLEVFLASV